MQAKTENTIVDNLSWLSEVELISVHVPKTAGSTFGYKILPQVYKAEEILYDYDMSPANKILQSSKLKAGTKVIHGHFNAKKYQEYCPNAKVVIWLRHPILLLISSYHFWLTKTDKFFDDNHRYVVSNKLSFADFVKQNFTRNIVCKYFARGMKIDDFYFVGFQEFFIDDLNVLRNKFDWSPLKLSASNRNAYENYQDKVMEILSDQFLIENIIALNITDMGFYQAALSLRYLRKGISNSLEMYELSLQELQSRLGCSLYE